MICPTCGNTITMQEYKCSKCGVDLHCNTPAERQKREEYANQMYASGQWRVPELKTVQSVVSTAAEHKTINEMKPKSRKPFIISTVVLSFLCIMMAVIIKIEVDSALDKSSEIVLLKTQISNLNEEIESLKTPQDDVRKNPDAKYWGYKYAMASDKRGLDKSLDILTKITGNDLSEPRSTLEEIYNTYDTTLNSIYVMDLPDSDKVKQLDDMDSLWQETIAKLYDSLFDALQKGE